MRRRNYPGRAPCVCQWRSGAPNWASTMISSQTRSRTEPVTASDGDTSPPAPWPGNPVEKAYPPLTESPARETTTREAATPAGQASAFGQTAGHDNVFHNARPISVPLVRSAGRPWWMDALANLPDVLGPARGVAKALKGRCARARPAAAGPRLDRVRLPGEGLAIVADALRAMPLAVKLAGAGAAVVLAMVVLLQGGGAPVHDRPPTPRTVARAATRVPPQGSAAAARFTAAPVPPPVLAPPLVVAPPPVLAAPVAQRQRPARTKRTSGSDRRRRPRRRHSSRPPARLLPPKRSRPAPRPTVTSHTQAPRAVPQFAAPAATQVPSSGEPAPPPRPRRSPARARRSGAPAEFGFEK
jgi:hypothetical protein